MLNIKFIGFFLFLSVSLNAQQIIHTDSAPNPVGPYSQAIKTESLVFVSGQIGLNPISNKLVEGGFKNELVQTLNNIQEILNKAGVQMKDVVKATVYLNDLANFSELNEVFSLYFPINPPARETIQAAALPKMARVEISVIAQIHKK